MCARTSFSTLSNLLKSASPTISTGFLEEPHGGITAFIFGRISSMVAIFIPSLEQASVEIIAGPPALETMTKSPFVGRGCFEKAVA